MEEKLLAVILSPRSRPWAEIVEAGRGVCRFLWIVDSRAPGMQHTAAMLRRFGKLIDIAGAPMGDVVRLAHAERPDGITSFWDEDLHMQAWLAAALDLPVRRFAQSRASRISCSSARRLPRPVCRYRDTRRSGNLWTPLRLGACVLLSAAFRWC